jgi:hypothetical protein
MIMTSFACLVPLVSGCRAAEQRAGGMVVRRGGDIVGSGGTIRVTDSVPGDVMLAGNELAFSGATGGDYLGAGGDQRVSGRVHGSARLAGGNVLVTAVIDRNATIAGGNVELREGGVVTGNAYLVGGNIVVEGTVRQLLRATGGTINIAGSVGDVNVSAGRLRVGPNARIDGDLRYRVPADNVQIDSAATITGQMIAVPPRDWSRVWWMLRLFWGLGFLLAGAVLVALLPGIAQTAADGLRTRPGVALGLGVMWLILLPLLIGVVAVTVIGVPLAMLLLGTYLIVMYLAGIVLALAIGRLALRNREGSGRGRLVAAFLLGGLALMLVSWIPVAGTLAIVLAIVLGSGALVMPVVRRRAV